MINNIIAQTLRYYKEQMKAALLRGGLEIL